MIETNDILASFRNELAAHLANYRPPAVDPLPISPWIASSLLQKAIRRGRADLALAASSTLMLTDPVRLWRRLGCIAFEDVGLADPRTVGLVTAAVAGKRVRATMGGEWKVAAWMTERLAASPKSRATDDLLMAVETLPRLKDHRRALAERNFVDLQLTALESADLYERAIAILYLSGTDVRRSRCLRPYQGDVYLAFNVLDRLAVPPTLLAIAREGLRRTNALLAPLFALLSTEHADGHVAFTDDTLPPEVMIGPTPGWALDGYTREGKEAIRRFLMTDDPFAAWAKRRLPESARQRVAALALFHVEGGRLSRRQRTPFNDELRRVNEIECLGVEAGEAREALEMMLSGIPSLNAIRADIMEGLTNV